MTKPIKFIMISLASSMILLPTVLPTATIYGQEMMQDTSVIHQSLMPQFKVHLQVDEFQGQDQSQIDYDIIDQDQQEVVYSYRWNEGQTANEPIQLPAGRYLFRLYDGGQFNRQGQKVIPYQVQWLDSTDEAKRHQASHSGELATLNDGSLVYDFAFEIKESIPAEDQPSQYDIYLVGESVTNPIVPGIEPKGLEEEDGLEEGDLVGNEVDQTIEEETNSLASDQGEANEVSSTSEAEPVTLQADQSGIQLIVKDSQGQPVKDVEVYVGYELLKTDDQGKAQLMNLAPMTYQVTLGILPETYQNAVLEPTEVNLQANQITELTLELEGSQEETATTPEPVTSQETSEVTSQETSEEPVTSETTTTTEEATGSLDFIIQDDQQMAVAGVRVQVIDDQGQAQDVTTDEQGRGRIDQLRPGTYHYQILEVPQNYTAKDELMTVQVLANEANQQWITIQSQEPSASLNLQVEDQDGQGIEGVTLKVTDPAGETVQETTDAQGRVSFADLPAGDYTYEVVDLEEDYQGTRTGQVSLTPGQSQTQDLTFQAPNPVGDLTLQLMTEDGQGLEGVILKVTNSAGETVQETTDAQGRVSFADLPAGDYTYEVVDLEEDYQGTRTGQVSLASGQSQTQDLTFQAPIPVGDLTLHLVTEDGQGIEGVTLKVTDPAGETVQETTDAQGQATFADLPSGDYTYEVVDLESDYQGTRTGQISLAPGQSQSKELTFQAPIPVGDLTLQLMTEDGQGLEGVILKVTNSAGETVQETTDAQGRVSFADLPAGDYTYEVVDLEEDYQGTRTGQVSLASGQSQTQDLTFQAPNPVGDLTLQLVTEDGQGIEGAVLEVNQEEVTTQADGLAKVKDLPVGTYPVRIKSLPTGYEWQDQDLEVTLEADEETIFQIQVAERTTTQSTTTTAEPTTTTQSTTTTAEPTTTTQSTTTTAEPTTTTQSTTTTAEPTTTTQSTTTTAEPTTTTQSTTSEPTTTTQTSGDQPTITIQSTTTEPSAPKPSLDHSVKDRDSKGVLYITQSDAKKVKKVTIQKVDLKPEDRPQALQGKDLDLYQVAPQDQAGNPVELADGSEVQLPIRSVNSQIQVLKVNGNQVENLPVTVNKQVATVKNNAQPGQLAVVYGNDSSQTNQTTEATSTTSQENKSSVVVKKSTDQRKAEDKQSGLPLTGERTSSIWLVLAGVFLLGGSYLVIKKWR
ncbi:SpaA isopeptide-forming pilin-related protein [Facklamia languida]